MEVELGSKVKDEITGFKGIATARCKYINGCVQYEVTSTQLKDGVPRKEYWVDEKRIILVDGPVKKKAAESPPGGPAKHSIKKSPPGSAGYEEGE